jgi:lysophospholipase L1-like esterase
MLAGVYRLTQETQPLTWVFTGDSITHGALYTEGHRSFAEHFAERIRWELRRFQDVVINTGICGERSEGLLANLDSRVTRFRPDVALILIGMNDCLAGVRGREPFRRNLQSLIGRLREFGVIPVLQTPNLIYTPNATSRCDLPAYVQIIREESAHMETGLIDHWNDWCAAKPEVGAILPWLQDESIHPNQFGYRQMSRTICHGLGLFDPNSLTCQLPVP